MDKGLLETYRRQEAERGYHFSDFEGLGVLDPEFERVRLEYVDMTYLRKDGALEAKYKELISAMILCFRGYPSAGKHIRRALREGLSVQQVVEALEMASIPGGQPTLHHGLVFLNEILKEEAEKKDATKPLAGDS